jgi:small GTP-binding protein
VGKSTLFNRLTRSRSALVADFSGLTRDRHYGEGRVGETPFIVVDTGGFEPVAKTGILHQMARQTKQAIAEADVVIFMVDARAGLNAHDHDISRLLRKLGQRVVLCVNKAEGMQHGSAVAEFHELGLGLPVPISAAHGDGIADLIEHYMGNAAILRSAAEKCGLTAFGGTNAPYIWVHAPKHLTSWAVFDKLLSESNVVVTPGSGFGPAGEGYFRISAFNSRANVVEVARRLAALDWTR